MITFKYKQVEGIPILSWCAKVEDDSSEVEVYHGTRIETRPDGFIEGTWDGDFDAFKFDEAPFLLGSGARINHLGQLIFAAPSHTLERIYTISTTDGIFLANSLPLLLSITDSKLLMNYLDYEKDLCSIVNGLDNYTKHIPLDDDRQLSLYYYTNLTIKDGVIVELEKLPINPFTSYSDYYNRLLNSLKAIQHNANAKSRTYHYGFVSTISKGYDSAAASVMAKKVGCDVALTFNAPARHAEDSGESIAQYLGYNTIVAKDASQFLTNESLQEAEFVSTGELGMSVVFTAFEDELRNNIVFIGDGGDFFWEMNEASNNRFIFLEEIYSTTSFIDHRLRLGYTILPLPFYGAVEWNSLEKITHSKEMEKFSIGGSYDRPIARRILEEAGVPRKEFGMDNIGSGINYRFDNFRRLKARMAPRSFKSYRDYYQKNKEVNLKTLKDWGIYIWKMRPKYLNYFYETYNFNKRADDTFEVIPNPGAPSLLIQWGLDVSVSQIKHILKQQNISY